MKRIIIKAFAKINLALDVLGKRQDGYHEVETIMQGIDLHDIIALEPAPQGINLSCNWKELGTGPSNLAYRAAGLLMKNYNISGVKIHLEKKIPLAAGLAGGSTDAAAVLLGINQLFSLGLSMEKLQELAATLGSDVPFCLSPLTALARGRGEVINELSPCPQLRLVLLKPSFGVSTKEVYEHIDKVKISRRPNVQELIRAIKSQNINLLFTSIGNVLEYSTFDLYPQMRFFRQELLDKGASSVMMSGSGPTMVAFLQDTMSAHQMVTVLKKQYGHVFATVTLRQEDIDERMVCLD